MLYAIPIRGSAWLAFVMPRYTSPRSPRLKVQLLRVMLSWIYTPSSRISACPLNVYGLGMELEQPSDAGSAPGRVRSRQASSGTKDGLRRSPANGRPMPQNSGLFTFGFVYALPFAFKHTGLKAGSTI